METSFTLTYKEEIEALQEDKNFEALGDAKYMFHEDVEARLEWAFYRPSGSHPDQVSDPDPMVSIMAFNHSRLGAYERFEKLNRVVVEKANLRVKIKNRSRMLFRAMVDDDFKELVAVLKKYPVFMDQAYDQVINGRIWNEHYADVVAASEFLVLAESFVDEKLIKGLHRRLRPIKGMKVEEAQNYLDLLCEQEQKMHSIVKAFYVEAFQKWLQKTSLHPLQVVVWKKKIDRLLE